MTNTLAAAHQPLAEFHADATREETCHRQRYAAGVDHSLKKAINKGLPKTGAGDQGG